MTVHPTQEDIEHLIALFEASDWKEIRLRIGGTELHLSKDGEHRLDLPKSRLETTPMAPKARRLRGPAGNSASAPKAEADPAEEPVPENWLAIKAPNLGTFYRAPKPGAAPYVEIGQQVSAESEVCLIEVMKLFTALRAGAAGVVRQICAEDGQVIESGQTLFYIEPSI